MQIISRKEAINSGLKRYFTGRPCKHGHVSERSVGNSVCLECKKRISKKWDDKNKDKLISLRLKNRERQREYCKKYYTDNKDRFAMKNKEYREAQDKEEISKYNKKYRDDNRDQIKAKKVEYAKANRHIRRALHQRKMKNNPDYQLQVAIRSMLHRVIGLTNADKKNSTFELIGYTALELRSHLESQFTEGMSWSNHGEWHIDHIIPVSYFIKNGETDPAIINSLSNLQPLWAKDNLIKSNKVVHSIE